MQTMIIINYYKPFDTNWDQLQLQALDIIAEHEKEVEDVEYGDLSTQQQYDDYREACMKGLKTFIIQVVNDWGNNDILFVKDKFYKKFEYSEMDGKIKNYQYPNLYRTSKEIFSLFKKEKVIIDSETFDSIHEIFNTNDEVVCNINYFEIEIREVKEDNDFLDNNGFGDLFE